MEVISIEEQEDGSAIVNLNMTEEENNMLVGFAVNTILKEQIEKNGKGE
jgi:N-dimethylarginine dimethylaminohydrolase